jgi:hypothetical protein
MVAAAVPFGQVQNEVQLAVAIEVSKRRPLRVRLLLDRLQCRL